MLLVIGICIYCGVVYGAVFYTSAIVSLIIPLYSKNQLRQSLKKVMWCIGINHQEESHIMW